MIVDFLIDGNKQLKKNQNYKTPLEKIPYQLAPRDDAN